MEHKKQHWIPQTYLKAWCDPATPPDQHPYVWVFPRGGGGGSHKSPKNLFHERDMYTITLADGNRVLSLEHGLAQLEDSFARIRRDRLEIGELPNQEERIYLAAFMTALRMRTQSQRDHLRGEFRRIHDKMKRFGERMRQMPPEQREAVARVSSIGVDRSRSLTEEQVESLAEQPLQSLLVPDIAVQTPMLAAMNWAIIQTEDPVGFITSDRPCTWHDPEAHKRPFLYRTSSLVWKTTEVTLPISPRQILFLSREGPTGFMGPIDSRQLDEINRRTRFFANKEVVVNRSAPRQSWFQEPGSAE